MLKNFRGVIYITLIVFAFYFGGVLGVVENSLNLKLHLIPSLFIVTLFILIIIKVFLGLYRKKVSKKVEWIHSIFLFVKRLLIVIQN